MGATGVGVIDVFTFGEAMIRLSVRPGETLETAASFDVHVAGAEANVAVALSRLGRSVTWVSRLPEGSLGRRVLEELRRAGVDCSGVTTVPEARMGTYFVELRAEPLAARVLYDRAGSATAALTRDDMPWSQIDRARIIHLSGITPALSNSCLDVVMTMAQRARDGEALLSVDVNYRAKLWAPEHASQVLAEVLRGADLIVCTREDAADLFEIRGDAEQAAWRLSKSFEARRVVVTWGSEGAWWWEEGSTGHVPSIPVSVVDRIGAGDAFTAGVLDGILDGDLERGVRRGTVLASIALTTRGDQVFATRDLMESLLDGDGRRVDR